MALRCLVTGASDPQSIGYASVEALLKNGNVQSMCIAGRDQGNVNAAVKQLSASGSAAAISGVVGDMKDPSNMKKLVEDAIKALGGGIDVLVVSGGNGGSEYLGLDLEDPAAYHMMYNVGVLSPHMLIEATIAQGNCKTIVVVSSLAPNVPWPDTAPFNYSKAAENCMIESLAFKHCTKGVRINGVLPSCIHTGYLDRMAIKKGQTVEAYATLRAQAHPMKRNGSPQEVAQAVAFLASDASSFMTGELMKVDGGLHLTNWFNQSKITETYVGGTTEGGK